MQIGEGIDIFIIYDILVIFVLLKATKRMG